jgi:hypothetical protein
MNYTVNITTVTQQLMAASRKRTAYGRVSQEIQPLLGYVWTFLRAHPELKWGFNVALYHELPPNGTIECGVQIFSPFDETADVVSSYTPAGRVATTAHFGRYDQLGAAHGAVVEFCKQNGHEIVLPFWEIYGHWNDDWAKVRTDVYYLIK